MNLNVESWKEFRLGDLFSEMYKAEAHVKGELECYDVPSDNTIRFISRTEMTFPVLKKEMQSLSVIRRQPAFIRVKTSCAEIIWLFVVRIG